MEQLEKIGDEKWIKK